MPRPTTPSKQLSMSEALASLLSDEAIAYINEKGAEVGTLSAVELKLQQKSKRLKDKVDETPEAQQLRRVKTKEKAVKAKRTEIVTKIAGVIEKELGKNADKAMEQLFGGDAKQLQGR